MEFHGRYVIPAAPDAVWAALHDPEILAASIPGCENVTRISDTDYQAQASLKVGPVRARFSGKVVWNDDSAPDGYTHAGVLKGEGQGGAAGFARGESRILLAADGDGTVLTYNANAVVGGKLAQIGQRLIDSTAKSIADAFFAKFSTLMGAEAPAEAKRGPVEVALKPQIWVAGLIGIVILLLILFTLVL